MSQRVLPFSAEALKAFEANRKPRWYHRLTDQLPWSEKNQILRTRRTKLLDIWSSENGYHPEPGLLGGGSYATVEPLHSIQSDGTQISNSTSETIVCPDYNIPAYYVAPGRTFRVWAFGVMSNVVTTPGTLTMRLRWGGVGGTALCASAAQGLDTTARTNSLWALLAYIVCRTDGSSGTFLTGGIMWGNVLSSTAANLLPALLGSAGTPLASGSAAVTVDTTAAKLLSVTGQFSVSTNPTNLTCHQRVLEVMF